MRKIFILSILVFSSVLPVTFGQTPGHLGLFGQTVSASGPVPQVCDRKVDDLEGTTWSNLFTDLSFKKGGIVEYFFGDLTDGIELKGDYWLDGNMVSMSFGDGSRAVGTITGNTMTVRWTWPNGRSEEFIVRR